MVLFWLKICSYPCMLPAWLSGLGVVQNSKQAIQPYGQPANQLTGKPGNLALTCVALLCVALNCFDLLSIALHRVALYCFTLHCIAFTCVYMYLYCSKRSLGTCHRHHSTYTAQTTANRCSMATCCALRAHTECGGIAHSDAWDAPPCWDRVGLICAAAFA